MLKHYSFLLCYILFLLPINTIAAQYAGIVERVQGDAQVIFTNGKESIEENDEIFKGDKISTDDDSELVIRMTDGAVLAVRPNSNITITDYRFNNKKSSNDNMLVKLLKGGLRVVTGAIGKKNPKKVKFKTPTATIGIRGTEFEVSVLDVNQNEAEAGTYNIVYKGETYIENSQGRQVAVMPDQAAFVPEKPKQNGQPFGLLNNIPNVFYNGGFDHELNSMQQEVINRLNNELGRKMPNIDASHATEGGVPTRKTSREKGIEMLGGAIPLGARSNGGIPGIPPNFQNNLPNTGTFNR